jgi:hypothetical protein
MAKPTKKTDESQPAKLARWIDLLIAFTFGLSVLTLVALFVYVLMTQVFIGDAK